MKRFFFLLLAPLLILFSAIQGSPSQVDRQDVPSVEEGTSSFSDGKLTHAPLSSPLTSKKSAPSSNRIQVDLKQVFAGSPTIYLLLLSLSILALFLTLYTFVRLRQFGRVSQIEMDQILTNARERNWDSVLSLCYQKKSLFCQMVEGTLKFHDRDSSNPVEQMKSHAKRLTMSTWQRIGLLNDIAMIAPMLGLLGTVLGMFFAFYDINRSSASITKFFDGLGVSVGTTVAGLIVSLFALMMHTLCKHRLIRQLALIEQDTDSIVSMFPKTQG